LLKYIKIVNRGTANVAVANFTFCRSAAKIRRKLHKYVSQQDVETPYFAIIKLISVQAEVCIKDLMIKIDEMLRVNSDIILEKGIYIF
jgi:hypothetical protein